MDAKPPVWHVYALALLQFPTALLLLLAVVAVRAALAGLSAGAEGFGPVAVATFTATLDDEYLILIFGAAVNAALFAALALGAVRGPEAGTARRRLRLHRVPVAEAVLAILGLLALTTALDSAVHLLGLGEYGRLADFRRVMSGLTGGRLLTLAVVLGPGAGVAEELFFRGYMLTRLELAHGRRWAVAITALSFGIFHWDPVHTPLAAAMGVYLGALVAMTGSIWPGICAHVVNNLLAALSAAWHLPGPTDGVGLGVGLAGVTAVLLVLSRRAAGRRARTTLPEAGAVW